MGRGIFKGALFRWNEKHPTEVSIRMRLIAFVKQMDRLMDRQQEVEGKDNFDRTEGQPVLITHMKPY